MGISTGGGAVRMLAAAMVCLCLGADAYGARIETSVTPAEHAVVLGGGEYAPGAQARLLVGPEVGYRFDHWEGAVPAGQENANPLILDVTTDCVLRAVVVLDRPTAGWYRGSTVVGWGGNGFGQITPPVELTNASAVSAGYVHSLALTAQGTVVAWGANEYGESSPPRGLSNIVAVAAGGWHSLALRADGRVVCWGRNDSRQAVPPILTNAIAIAAGASHSLALRADGTVVGWGSTQYSASITPKPGTTFVAISAGDDYNLALRENGTVLGWGDRTKGKTVPPEGIGPVRAVSAGGGHSMALLGDGSVVAWGDNRYGQTNLPPELVHAIAVSAGDSHSLALAVDHTVLGWGDDRYGQASPPGRYSNVVSIAAGNGHSLAVLDAVWGLKASSPPSIVQEMGASITLAPSFAGVGLSAGRYQWYRNGAPIEGAKKPSLTLPQVSPQDTCVYQMVCFDSAKAILTPATEIYAYSREVAGEGVVEVSVDPSARTVILHAAARPGWRLDHWEGDLTGTELRKTHAFRRESPNLAVKAVFVPASKVNVVVAASAHGAVIGADSYDQRAEVRLLAGPEVGFRFDHWEGDVPVGEEATNPIMIEAVSDLALQAVFAPAQDPREGWFQGGTVVPWGVYLTTDPRMAPPPTDLTNAIAIAASQDDSVVLRADGTVAGWGYATPPAGLSNVVAVTASASRALALRADGTVVAWGYDGSSKATVPPGLGSVSAISAGDRHTLAAKPDGTVTAWGDNAFGKATPPPGLSNVVAVAAGGEHSLVLKEDGTVVGFGGNVYLQAMPPNHASSNITAIAAGGSHSLAIRRDGTLAAWGWDEYGQCSYPAGLGQVTEIAAGKGHSLALTLDGVVAGWGMNFSGQASPPLGLSNVVAVAAGDRHSLAIRATTWGLLSAARRSVIWEDQERLHLAPKFVGVGARTRSYQWCLDGVPVPGSTNAVLDLGTFHPVNPGRYQLLAMGATNAILTPPTDVFVYEREVEGQGRIETWTEPGSNIVRFRAVPAVGWRLDHWEGGLHSGDQETDFAFDSDHRSVLARAVFVPAGKVIVSTSVSGHGVVVGAGLVDQRATVTLIAVPEVGWQFERWEGDVPLGQERNGRCTFEAVGDVALRAVMVKSGDPGDGWFQGGSVVAWGSDTFGEATPPAGLTNVVAVAAGSYQSFALKADGTVVGWGLNNFGQAAGLTNAIAIAAGGWQRLVLKADGRVVLGTAGTDVGLPPSGVTTAVAVAAGYHHGLLLKADGTVIGWGIGDFAQVNPPSGLTNVGAIAAGTFHSLALKKDGTVIGWGRNTDGAAQSPPGLSNVVAIAAGLDQSLALLADQSVVGWGTYQAFPGQSVGKPATPADAPDLVAIAMGDYHSLGLRANGRVAAWGQNSYGQCSPPWNMGRAMAIAAGQFHSLAVVTDKVTLRPTGPQLFILEIGQSVSLNRAFAGQESLEWYHNGSEVPGETMPTLRFEALRFADAGEYQLVAMGDTNALVSPPTEVYVYGREVVGNGSIQVVVNEEARTVMFQATPTAGWKFDHWEGQLNGEEATATFAFDSEHATALAKAVFAPVSTPSAPRLAATLAKPSNTVTLRWPVGPDVLFVLEFKQDLSAEQWIQVTHGITNNATEAVYTDLVVGPQRFYRLRKTP